VTDTASADFGADHSGACKVGPKIDFSRGVARLDSIHGAFHVLARAGHIAMWPPRILREIDGLVSDLESLAGVCDAADGARTVLYDSIVDAEVNLPQTFRNVAKEITRFLRSEYNDRAAEIGAPPIYGKK
jgi:hypothetical protein